MTDLDIIAASMNASMQEQLARRDHRIAVLDAIVAAQAFRLTVLEAREGGLGPKPDPLAPAPSPHYIPCLGMVLNGHLMPPYSPLATDPASASLALSRAMSAPETNPRLGVIHER